MSCTIIYRGSDELIDILKNLHIPITEVYNRRNTFLNCDQIKMYITAVNYFSVSEIINIVYILSKYLLSVSVFLHDAQSKIILKS